MIKPIYKLYPLSKVTLTDDYLVNAFQKEVKYLTSLDPERLLAGFYETAGIRKRGLKRYGGWENLLIGGHTLGHYLAACVYAYETPNSDKAQKEKLYERISALVKGLDKCQDKLGTGFVFGAIIKDKKNVELQFDMVEQGKTDIFKESWVPWYTLHKIFEGLIAVAKMDTADPEGLKTIAVKVLKGLADWSYGRTLKWDAKTRRTVLDIEYGGMNDVLFDTYVITKDKNHRKAAMSFVDRKLYNRILNAKPGDDVLNNVHANTTIPKFIGAIKGYYVTKSDFLFRSAEKFWELVTTQHTYITGGNSEWEHFGKDAVLNAERTNCNCETCNVYNMLKLSMLLFNVTNDKKYMDWYENAFINQILSSQNPETGMTTYFQSMATGYFKTYGNPEEKFWCCVGTGMENFSKLGESFYMEKDGSIYVNQLFSSVLEGKGFKITQKSSLPEGNVVEFKFSGKCNKKNIFLRIPEWITESITLFLKKADGRTKKASYRVTKEQLRKFGKGHCKGEYIGIEGPFENGDVLTCEVTMDIIPYNLPDNKNVYGFKFGPVVLSGELGSENMETTETGVSVTIPKEKILPSFGETIRIKKGTVKEFMENAGTHFARKKGKLAFELKDTDAKLTYSVHYRQYRQRYGLYFEFTDEKSAK